MGNAGEGGASLVGAVREIGSTVVESVGLRLQLLGVELQQEKRRLFGTVFLAAFVALAAFMALLFCNLALVVTFWDDRVLVIGLSAAGHLLLAIVCALILRRRFTGPAPFSGTAAELGKDVEALGIKR